MKNIQLTVILFFLVCVGVTTNLWATEPDPQAGQKMISLTELAPEVTPVSDYTGEIWGRSTAFGDIGGERQALYEKGITLDVSITQVVQGVVSGGAADNGGAYYNGLMDYGITLDTGKLGWWPGGLLVANAQTSWGNALKTQAGNISPVNYTALYPIPFENATFLSEYYLMQGLPHDMLLIIGRIDGVHFLDRNRFANEPRNQFLNVSLNNDVLYGEFMSFSTYGALLEVPVTKDLSLAGAIYTPNTQPGDYDGDWSEIGAGGVIDYKWAFFENLGGEANVTGVYSSKDTAAIDNPRLVPGIITGDVPTKTDNWMIGLDVEQYLWKPKGSGSASNHAVRTQSFDYQEPGIGFFFRFGYAPEDRNPWNMSVSGGLSARGVIPGRPYDRMGIGAYGLIASKDLSNQIIIGELLGDEVGFEAFYNFAITPWLQLSADIQWIKSGIENNDDAVVLGTRLFTQF